MAKTTPMTMKEIQAMYKRLKKQGKSLEEIKAAGIAETKRRREARIQATIQQKLADKERKAREDLKANPPQVDPEYVARQRELDEKAKVICEQLWHDIWVQEILPRAKGVK